MKSIVLAGLLSIASIGVAHAGDVATVATGEGKVFESPKVVVVRKTFDAEHPMKKHHHPGAEVVVTVVTGTGKFTFNDKEIHEVKAGDVVTFNGDNYIQGDFTQPSLLSVVLVPLK